MRALFLILILIVVAAIVAVGSGFLHIEQTRNAEAPAIEATDGKIKARKGTTPAFEVQTGSVDVGVKSKEVEVAVPTLSVDSPADDKDKAAPAQ